MNFKTKLWIKKILKKYPNNINIYNYNETVYFGSNKKLKINCNIHGEFEQLANAHYNGSGCPKCGKIKNIKNNTKTNEQWLLEVNKIHNNFYIYPEKYLGSEHKIKIICPEHGEFEQLANAHYNGSGCPKCGKIKNIKNNTKTNEQWLLEVNKIHNNFYIYPEKYLGSEHKIKIICPEHGEFEQLAKNHLKGHGCPKCNYNKLTNEQWLLEVNKIHNNFYTYPEKYENSINKIKIICPEHGEFEQLPYQHKQGCGCPKCGMNSKILFQTKSHDQWLLEVNKIHNNFYKYPEKIINSKQKIIIICPTHGEFAQRIDMHLKGHGCPQCASERTISKSEQELFDYIKSLNINNIIQSDRKILNNKELDIYLPDYKLAFEFNGLYWHNEHYKENNYHLLKTEECLTKGITLIHIFEDEWLNKKDIVKSRILYLLNKVSFNRRIYARKCYVKEIDISTAKKFLERNHIQGFVGAKIHIGLFIKIENKEYLVSYMSFGSLRKNLGNINANKNYYELLRFCNTITYSVIGGASKLLKYFEKKYKPEKIISYADRRWSNGNLYEKLGFTLSHKSKPNYYYIDGLKRINRFNFRKDILISKYNCPIEISEKEFCREHLCLSRIYDCGNLVYEKFKYGTINIT